MEHGISFQTGEFAKLCGVNKRTLQYYDEEGIFAPSQVEENGYRRYSIRQLYPFMLLRMLRQMGISLGEIREYGKKRSPETLDGLLERQEQWIEEEIRRLQAIRECVADQRRMLQLAARVECGKVQTEQWPEEPYIRTRFLQADTLEGRQPAVDRVVMEHLRYILKYQLQAGFSIGALVDCRDLEKAATENQALAFFSRVNRKRCEALGVAYELRPAGTYLVTYHKGNYMDTRAAYRLLQQYVEAHPQCRPGSCAYEESVLDELSTGNPEQFITRIAMPVEGE